MSDADTSFSHLKRNVFLNTLDECCLIMTKYVTFYDHTNCPCLPDVTFPIIK